MEVVRTVLERASVRAAVTCICVLGACCVLSACGGSSGSTRTGPTGPQPDFSLSTQPATVVIAPGGTQSAIISINGENGFSGSAQITTTPPSGVSVSPPSFSLSVGTPQQLTISASSSVSPGTLSASFTGASGALTHSAQLQIDVDLPMTGSHPPFRTRYLRTDLQYDPNLLEFFPPHFTAYDSANGYFFVSNPTLNRIDVFDGATESQVGSIIVPYVWGIDITPDGSTMYAATAFGDVYLIDPLGMSVVQRFPSASLGSQGYMPSQLFILASGKLVLFGGAALLNVDGSQTFAIWDPTTNNLQVINADVFGQAAFVNIGAITLTADRTKVVVGSADSDDDLGLYDPSTGVTVSGRASLGIVTQILPTPDGSRLFMEEDGQFEVFNAQTLAQLGTFTSSGFGGSTNALLSYDGSTLFSTDELGDVTVYDTNSFSQTGWIPNFDVSDLQAYIVPLVSDETGLVVGPIGHGVAFLDTTQLEPGLAQTVFNIGFLSPGTGSVDGGTSVQAEVSEQNATSPENIDSGTIYIGNAAANNIVLSNKTATALTPPASAGGAADFTVVLPGGSIQLNPENFSYGPTIVELSTNAASADGGGQGVIFGYGLGQQPSGATVSVGGQPAQVTQVITSFAYIVPIYPFPIEAVLFTIPPGTAGTTATVTVSTAAGTATSAIPLTYVPSVQQYSLPSATLMQGVYDPTRSVIYFTDQSQIDVFSTSGDNWLSPITISYTNASSRLTGVALSQDSNTLAVSDSGNASIYVLNPSAPSAVKSFSVQSTLAPGYEPYALTVNNSGVVYYKTYGGDSQSIFHMLNTNTSAITDFEFGGGSSSSSYDRLLISPTGQYVYGSGPFIFNTATNAYAVGYQAETVGDDYGNGYNLDMALSQDGSTLVTDNVLTDANLNMDSDIAYVDRDTWLPVAVYGQKLNTDGSLIFQPLTNGIDELNAVTGLLAYRIALPIQIANAYDALVIDNNDNLLFAITPTGIATINLSSLPTPASAHRAPIRAAASIVGRKPLLASAPRARTRQAPRFVRPHLRYESGLQGKKAK